MAIAYRQRKYVKASSPNAVAFDSAVLAGSLIVVVHADEKTDGATTNTCADSRTNSYTALDNVFSSGTGNQRVFYAPNVAAGATTVTVTSNAGADIYTTIYEFTGVATSSPVDTSNQASVPDTSSPYQAIVSITTTTANTLLFTAASDRGNNRRNFSDYGEITESYTDIAGVGNGYGLVSSSGTRNVGLTADGNEGSGFSVHAVAFKELVTGKTTKNTRSFPLGIAAGMNRRM